MGTVRRGPAGLAAAALLVATLPLAGAATGADRDDTVELRVDGRLQTVIVDDFGRHRSRTETQLVLRDGTRLDVRRTPDMPTSGRVTATVEVTAEGTDSDRLDTRSAEGLRLARTLEDETLALQDATFTPAAAATATAATHHAYVAVVRNHGDWGGTPLETLEGRVQDVLDGWELESGAELPSFEVAGWKDFTADGCGLSGDFWDVTGEAAAELYPTVDFQLAPNHLVVLVPDECEDAAVGTASVGSSLGSGGVSVNSLEQDYGPPVLAHELGHNFGLDHSEGEICDFSGWCFLSAYGDFYDVMGGATRGTVPALNSPHRDDLGLLADSEVALLELPLDLTTTSRTVTLRPRSDGDGLRTLKLVDPETLVPWYVDYRSGTGRDATAGYRLFPDYPPGVAMLSGESSGSRLWSQADEGHAHSWGPGTTFTNEQGTISVSVDAVDPGVSATVTATISSDASPLVVPAAVLVTGVPEVDTYLDFDPTGWPEDASYRFRWLVDGQPYAISDFLWVAPDLRGRMIQLEVSAARPGHRGVVRYSSPIGPVTQPVTGSVRIQSDPVQVGRSVTSTVTTLPRDAERAYQWYAAGDPVPGATATSYTPVAADAGKLLSLRVTASRENYDTTVLRSNEIGPVAQPLLPLTASRPTISGTPRVGNRLTARPGTWTTGTRFSYRWLADGRAISGADGRRLLLRRTLRGKRISVRVTGRLDGYTTVSKTSARTARVRR